MLGLVSFQGPFQKTIGVVCWEMWSLIVLGVFGWPASKDDSLTTLVEDLRNTCGKRFAVHYTVETDANETRSKVAWISRKSPRSAARLVIKGGEEIPCSRGRVLHAAFRTFFANFLCSRVVSGRTNKLDRDAKPKRLRLQQIMEVELSSFCWSLGFIFLLLIRTTVEKAKHFDGWGTDQNIRQCGFGFGKILEFSVEQFGCVNHSLVVVRFLNDPANRIEVDRSFEAPGQLQLSTAGRHFRPNRGNAERGLVYFLLLLRCLLCIRRATSEIFRVSFRSQRHQCGFASARSLVLRRTGHNP